ncbi:hypothetical protein K7X08_022690 [Anisodus acutangulus]|uniref:Uncharacterized protein n=1 Tax=Anisodus acutangulus TaxID=402998 RepID=A0A9Q1MI85_9SOLA|nr:hypothetical protein K7X08_022690 [Anisodus acutangulus]
MEGCALCCSCYDVEKDTLAFTKVDAFLPGKIYYHGCLKSFLEITKWKGPEVIYFGDQLFSDLRGPSKAGLHATVTSSVTSETRYNMKGMFNKSFGATFLTDTVQESAFAYHIHQYADIYTSKPKNFLYYPPEARLHVPFDIKIMPHHLKVSSNLFRTRLHLSYCQCPKDL